MRLVVCGGKQFRDLRLVERALDAVHAKRYIRTLIIRGMQGAEELAHYWAVRVGIEAVITIPARPDINGVRSYHARDREIFRRFKPGGVVAFPGGGTSHLIQLADELDVPVWRVPPDWR